MIKSTTPCNTKIYSIICAVLFLLTINIQFAQAQFKIHDLGKFKYEHQSGESLDYTGGQTATGQWPQDVFQSGNFTMSEFQRHVGSYVDETGTTQPKTTHGGASLSGEEPFTITEYRRHAPPEVLVYADGLLQESSIPYNGIVDPDIPCDVMVVNRFKASPGFHGISRSYSFVNSNHDDYIIYEAVYTFTGDHDADEELEVQGGLSDVYFAIGYNMQTVAGTWISYSRWYEEGKDEWTNYETFTSDQVTGGRDITVSYTWDGDYPELSEFEPGNSGPNGNFDDTGDPRWALGEEGPVSMPSGEFLSAVYSGFAILHADDPNSPGTDDITQPLSIISGVSVYDMWDNAFPGHNTLFDWAASGQKTDIEDTDGYGDGDPSALEGDYPWQSVGPYDFDIGDSIKIVHVFGSNGISRNLSIEKGLEWRAWYRGESGADFDDDAKNELLASGKDSLFQSIDNAFWAWSNGLDVPDPLPAPDLTVTSGPNRIDLEWEDMSAVGDPDTDVPDLDHYNIYRKLGSFLVDTDDELRADGSHLLWEHIATVPATQTTYTDNAVIRGENYHYAVTAVDNGSQNTTGLFPGQPLESSLYANRSEIAAKAFLPGEDNSDNVLIVPNPYIAGAEDFNFAGSRSNTILFVNLPSYCTLSIYTVTGDLIKKIEHSSGSADDEWNLITETNQFVASGVYILKVSNAKDLNGNSISDTIEKFVVIR